MLLATLRPAFRGTVRHAALSVAACLGLLVADGCATSHAKRVAYRYEPAYGVASPRFERTLMSQNGGLTEGNRARLLNNGDEFFPAILEAVRGARHSINIELYIFAQSRMGRALSDALCAKAREGVEVRVLVDGMGARTGALGKEMRAAGVRYRIYKPFGLHTILKAGDRTHRKIVTVDGRIGFAGGFGVDDRWAGDARNPDEWREVVVQVAGPVVLQLQRLFYENWLYSTGEVLDGEGQFPPPERPGTIKAQAVGSSRTAQLSLAKLHYYVPIQAAREQVWIANAYFLPDRDFRRALIAAARRGVDVRLLLPGPITDLSSARYASRSDYAELLKGGVSIYEFQPTMMHSKAMLVDDIWVSIGSINFTARSMNDQAEANVAFYDRGFAAEVRAMFEADFARCQPVTPEEWKQRGGWERCKEAYFRLYKAVF